MSKELLKDVLAYFDKDTTDVPMGLYKNVFNYLYPPKEELKEPERITVVHMRKGDFVHFGGMCAYTFETFPEFPESKFPAIKQAIEQVLNDK